MDPGIWVQNLDYLYGIPYSTYNIGKNKKLKILPYQL